MNYCNIFFKRLYLYFMSIAIFVIHVHAQKTVGYQLKATLKPYTSGMCYLAHYYLNDKSYVLVDSALMNSKSEVIFKGNTMLKHGIYVIGYPNKGGLMQLLIDGEQQITLTINTKQPESLVVRGSAINTDYNNYQLFVLKHGKLIDSLRTKLALLKSKKDSLDTYTLIEKYNTELIQYRDNYVAKANNNLLAVLFTALKQPTVPKAKDHPNGKYDTAYARKYFIDHYWDGVDVADDRLLRTPFFEQKIDFLFNTILQGADEIFFNLDKMLGYSKHNDVMFKYYMNKFTQAYFSPKYMGLEKVFVKLYEKYYANQKYDWLTAENEKIIREKAITTMANMIGDLGYNLTLADTTNTITRLYDIKADYTVLCFWDPKCGHCRTTMPKLDSFYNAKWRNLGITMLGILVNNEVDEWKKFIVEKKLYNWKHMYQNEALLKAEKEIGGGWTMRSLYDAYTTPKIYLLDKEKRIVARSLEPPQLDTLLQIKIYGKIIN
jgi:thiol-disulfide isomerase/thioredoxin